MRSLVVFLACVCVCRGSLVGVALAQPPHQPALVLDAHGRPLDTAAVLHARALHLQAKALEHQGYLAAPLAAAAYVHSPAAAVSHQARVDVHSVPAHLAYAAYPAYPAYHGLSHAHLLKKRSLALAHVAYSAPSAVSQQSRVDVVSSPAVVSHAVAPVYAHAAPVFAHVAPAAVSHQSRVDVRTSPVLTHSVYATAPLVHHAPHAYAAHASPVAYSVHASPLSYSAHVSPLADSSYGSPLAYSSHGSPLAYSSHGSPLAYSAPFAHAW